MQDARKSHVPVELGLEQKEPGVDGDSRSYQYHEPAAKRELRAKRNHTNAMPTRFQPR